MHPEIKRFWEQQGVVNCINEASDYVTNVPYYYVNMGQISKGIATTFPNSNELTYRFDDNLYTKKKC